MLWLDLWIVSNEGHLLQETSSLWVIYVSQFSINNTTYHHSRFLIITARFQSRQTRIISFSTAKILNTRTSKTPTHNASKRLLSTTTFFTVWTKTHMRRNQVFAGGGKIIVTSKAESMVLLTGLGSRYFLPVATGVRNVVTLSWGQKQSTGSRHWLWIFKFCA